jgi:hypothetical protein
MYVRLADPARRDPDQHLASARFGQLNALDMEGAAPLVNDSCCDFYRDRPTMDLVHCVSPFPLPSILMPVSSYSIRHDLPMPYFYDEEIPVSRRNHESNSILSTQQMALENRESSEYGYCPNPETLFQGNS